MKSFFITILLTISLYNAYAQTAGATAISYEQYTYPFRVYYMPVTVETDTAGIAYMDVAPQNPNGKNVILFHGKNFPSAYWETTIRALTSAGYRVIAPDALGFGKSSRPVVQYSFSLLAAISKKLLDTLGIRNTAVIGHSMGGMLAARFTLSYPQTATCLVLEDAIGLEDWRSKGVPYRYVQEWYGDEMKKTYESIKEYHQTSYYPVWKPEYEEWVRLQYAETQSDSAERYAWVNALTYDMIYNQPVVHEFRDIKAPALVVVGAEDKTKLAKEAPKAVTDKLGHYRELGKQTAKAIPRSELIIYEGVGHVPHLQVPERFHKDLLQFLSKHNK